MGTAPTPGVSKRKKQAEQARKVHTITIRRKKKVVKTYPATAFKNLPLATLADVRDQTRRPLDYWLYPISTESVRVLAWIATNAHTVDRVSFAEFEAEWLEEFPDLEPREIEFEEDDGESDDPQS